MLFPSIPSDVGLLTCNRDENTKRPLPRRLQELVAQYPYTTSPDPTADGLLTRPRFSTRHHDALFLRVEAVYTDNSQVEPSRSPVSILADALKSEPKSNSGAHVYLWDQVKAAATSDSDDRSLPAILSDDTINLLSLVSTDPNERVLLGAPGAAPDLVTPLSPVTETFLSTTANGNGVPVPDRKPTIPSSTPQSPKDWAEFSSAGFGEVTISKNFASTLLDKDLEVTEPPVQRKLSKRKEIKSTVSTQTSTEFSSPVPKPDAVPAESEGPKLTLVATEIVQLDEAFIDFWRDAIVDPVSSDWPKFVVGELKHPITPHPTSTSSRGEVPPGPINWIIIEEKIKRPTPPPTPVIPHEAPSSGGLKVGATPLKRTSSPRPSFGDKKGTLSATFKRFTLFGGSRDDLVEDVDPVAGGSGKKDSPGGKKKKGGASRSPDIGELGEVLSEEPEPQPEIPQRVDEPKKVERTEEARKERDRTTVVAADVVGGPAVGAVLATVAGSDGERVRAVKGVPPKEETRKQVTRQDATTKADELPALPAKREVAAPAVGEPGQAQKSLPGIPPAVKEPPRGPALAAIEEVVSENTSIVEEAAPQTVADEPTVPTPEASVVETEPDLLPPAPESVVSHGETPGPQLALNSTEAGLHQVPEPAIHVGDIPPVDTEKVTPEPTIEHLEDKAEDPAADVGVDLDPVPIIPNDPVEPVQVEPESQLEPPATVDENGEEPIVQEDTPSTKVPTPVLEQELEPQPIFTEDTLPGAFTWEESEPAPTETEPHPPV